MRVVIVGAGKVGTFIAGDLAAAGHEVVVVERTHDRVDLLRQLDDLKGVEWIVADACEVSQLATASPQTADVFVAVTSDNEDNLVASLLAKQEFGVPRSSRSTIRPTNGCSRRLGHRPRRLRRRICCRGSVQEAVQLGLYGTGLLTTPLRDRFGMTYRLDYYGAEDLARIVRRSARIQGAEIENEAAEEISRRARGTPRVANRILRRVRDVAQVRHDGAVTIAIAEEALGLLEVDGEGLERIDRELLRAILDKFDGGPVGLSMLAVSLGEETDTIEDVYEPYLLQLGLIQRTPRGRVITKLGRAHVGAAAKAESSLF